jgi:hypothetical protein
MSRTIRFRKGKYVPWWNNYEWKHWVEIPKEEYLDTRYDTRLYSYKWSSRGIVYEKKVVNKAIYWQSHKDSTYRCKEPGPKWFRNLFTERPQRREVKRQLNKFLLDPDFEVLLDSKASLDYFT